MTSLVSPDISVPGVGGAETVLLSRALELCNTEQNIQSNDFFYFFLHIKTSVVIFQSSAIKSDLTG